MSLAEEIVVVLESRPFAPFTIHLTDQRIFEITEPHKVTLSEDKSSLALYKNGLHLLHISQVTGIQVHTHIPSLELET